MNLRENIIKSNSGVEKINFILLKSRKPIIYTGFLTKETAVFIYIRTEILI